MIHGERTTLRPVSDADVPHLLTWAADPELNRLVEGDYPGTVAAARGWAEEVRRQRHRRYFIITDEGRRPIGDTELDFIAWRSGEAELRIRIGRRDLWGRGYGTDSILALLRYAFFEMGLRRIYLRVFADNLRAIRCYRRCGFKPEGEIVRVDSAGRPRRIVLMRILKEEFAARPGMVRAATG